MTDFSFFNKASFEKPCWGQKHQKGLYSKPLLNSVSLVLDGGVMFMFSIHAAVCLQHYLRTEGSLQ